MILSKEKFSLDASSEELIPCDYPGCNQYFRSRFSCKRHQLVHTKEKKFICKECGKKFSFAQHLREHGYRHENLKPYNCGIDGCKGSFRHSSELSLHRRTHPGYRLKKYHYVEKTKNTKKIDNSLRKKYGRVSKAESTDVNVESSASKGRTEINLRNQQQKPANDTCDLDFTFLQYIQNITVQDERAKRPKLPLSNIGSIMEERLRNSSKSNDLVI